MALGTLISGCGTVRFAYNIAPDLSHGWLDGYVGFDDTQSTLAREQLAAFFRWHRASQLTTYAQFLARSQSEAGEATTPARACRWYDDALAHLRPALDAAVPLATPVVQAFTSKQLQNLERKYGKVNQEFRETYLQPVPKDRLKASVKRAVDRAESMYGALEPAQVERLTRGLAASPFDPEAWLAERVRRQQDTVKTLRRLLAEHAPADAVQAALKQLADQAWHSPDPAYRAYQERLQQYNCGLVAQLHNSTSREQRLNAVAKLKGWEDDARALAASGAGARN